ncbi:TetR family transcriptional regulator C-terminal domain-containing protein [Asanoa sp. WMMD1127]|uniref:TetR/AcrR family transcriptional regulator n=1 Tax=Asanoa sp. WMMD1127 TaxID=3016107 RepID=UPI002416F518|nr:TetR family transcriptional regulator C-terminal domain-containing protein [Asanoa sp. WMMD1127]MDG4827649.1 TetR family transcriptional regulator C-terminal domain-containing protein [Asanoa sp. WMMD1127]
MPKRVDPTERRTLIADALMRVAAQRGLEAVSLRHVAAEAGATTGLVQHYFRTKDEMMLFALEVVSDRTEARIGAAVGALGPDPAPRDLVRAMVTQMLPLDEERRADGKVALAFLAYAATRPSVAEVQRRGALGLRDFFATLLPTGAATTLLALVEGLGLYMLSGTYPAEVALRTLDDFLDAAFSPAAGRP